MRCVSSGPGRRGAGLGASRGRRVPAVAGLLLVLGILLGLASAGYEGTSPLELRDGGPPVGVVSNVITGPVRAVLPAAHVVTVRTSPSLAPSSLVTILLLLALLGGLAAVARTSWSGGRRGHARGAEVAIAHAVPSAWRGPPPPAR